MCSVDVPVQQQTGSSMIVIMHENVTMNTYSVFDNITFVLKFQS